MKVFLLCCLALVCILAEGAPVPAGEELHFDQQKVKREVAEPEVLHFDKQKVKREVIPPLTEEEFLDEHEVRTKRGALGGDSEPPS